MREKYVFGVVNLWCGRGVLRGKAGQETMSILWSENTPTFGKLFLRQRTALTWREATLGAIKPTEDGYRAQFGLDSILLTMAMS
jgi:hypothetical protein